MPRPHLPTRRAFRTLPATVALLLATGTTACKPADVTVVPGVLGPYALRVVNNGSTELRDLVVLTSDRDSVTIANLQPGATATFDRIGTIHETLAVRAVVGGKPVALIPVEGFAGFNPVRPVGVYEVTLRAAGNPPELSISLRRI